VKEVSVIGCSDKAGNYGQMGLPMRTMPVKEALWKTQIFTPP